MARELATLSNQAITEVVEAALDALTERENEAKEASLAEIWSQLPFEDADARPLKKIRDEFWGGL